MDNSWESKNELEEIAKDYDNVHNSWRKLQRKIREKEFSIFSQHAYHYGSVMEIGLGDGVFTEKLAKRFEKVFAVDASKTTIEKVKEKLINFKNVFFIESFVENLQFEGTIDNIVMSHLLEHLENPVAALKHLKSICHKDTILYISVPNAMSLHRQVAVKMGLLENPNSLNETDLRLGHKRVYYPEEFKADVLAAGFQIIKFGGCMLKPLTNKQIEETWNEEMIQGFIELGDEYPELCGDIYIIAKKGEVNDIR